VTQPDDTSLGYSTVDGMTSQAAKPNGGGIRYARYGGKFMRRRRSWKRGSELKGSRRGSDFK
jgi:hypothetical protein